jgi:hypothetical protein
MLYDRLVFPAREKQSFVDVNPFFNVAGARNIVRVTQTVSLAPTTSLFSHRALVLFSLARQMALPSRPAGMEDRFLLYAYEQCALEATKNRTFANEEELSKCLEALRDFLIPSWPSIFGCSSWMG